MTSLVATPEYTALLREVAPKIIRTEQENEAYTEINSLRARQPRQESHRRRKRTVRPARALDRELRGNALSPAPRQALGGLALLDGPARSQTKRFSESIRDREHRFRSPQR